jgi:hypothetical protein
MMRKSTLLFGILFFLSSVMTTISLPLQARAQEESECKACQAGTACQGDSGCQEGEECTSCQGCGGSLADKLMFADVVGVDLENNQLTVNYLSYDNEQGGQRQETVVAVNEQTQYKNIDSFEDIKVNDPIDIQYIVDADGKTVALHITLVEELLPR